MVKDGVAEWTDRAGCKRSACIEDDKVVIATAEWTDRRGKPKSAPLGYTGNSILQVDRYWMGSFTDARGKRVRKSTRTTDRAAAQRIANRWESDAQLRHEGVVDAVDESLARHAVMPISEHLDAFIAFRATKGGTEEHRDRTKKHIEEFITEWRWTTISDISADDVTAHVTRMNDDQLSPRTIQARLQSIKSFTKWLTDHHRLRLNPLSMIRKPDPKAGRRHERRMLLREEWIWLVKWLQHTEQLINGMGPCERELLYRFAIQTGLRSGEIEVLTRGRLVLDSSTPHIRCKAAGTKNRKNAKQYVDQSLAASLAEHVERKHPAAPVFGFNNKDELARSIQADLKGARSLWLQSMSSEKRVESESSDFLAAVNHEGEHLVFHSLRHTCGAWLAIAGEHPKTVQTVMRHGTITLTLDAYGHLFPGQAEGAVNRLSSMMAG